ncbi:MAG TPA: hypothetical protein VEP90_22980, partial [Methylomirabilota bacterium]|nr:hypothetical protein [Methylomirabilota bacterium]
CGTLAAPVGKGPRLIICHAGGMDGWINAEALVFQSKKTGDYHEDMDSGLRAGFQTLFYPIFHKEPSSSWIMLHIIREYWIRLQLPLQQRL